MADNVAITAGSGTSILTDDCTTGHAQVIKLAVSTDGSATLIPADAGGLLVNLGANNDVTLATLPALVAGTANIGDVDVLTVPAPLSTTGAGTEAAALRVTLANDSTGLVSIDDNGASLTIDAPVGTPAFVRLSDGAAAITTLPVSLASVPSHAVTNAGTFAVQASGDVAHDTADSGNPQKMGGKAIAGLSTATLVAAADRTDMLFGLDGAQIVRPYCGLEDIVSGVASNTDGTSFQVLAAGAAGIKHYLTTIIIVNTSTAAIFAEIKDGTTVKATVPVPAQGGATVNLPVPIAGTAATAWNCDPSAATTTVYCTLVAFKSKI